jgi:hypothetical protein
MIAENIPIADNKEYFNGGLFHKGSNKKRGVNL